MLDYYTNGTYSTKLKRYLTNNSDFKPVFINANNINDYVNNLNSLSTISKVLNLSEFCKTADDTPGILAFIDYLNDLDENTTIVGLSTFLLFIGDYELKKIYRKLISKEYTQKIVVLCYQSEQYLKEIWNKDHRLARQIILLDGERDELPQVTLVNCNMDCNYCLCGFKKLLSSLEKNPIGKVVVKTKKNKKNFMDSLIFIKEISTPYHAILDYDMSLCSVVTEKFGTTEQWKWLNEKVSQYGSLNLVFTNELGAVNNLDVIFHNYKAYEDNLKWLYALALKINGSISNEYLDLAVNNIERFGGDLLTSVFRTILDIDYKNKKFNKLYNERKLMVQFFPDEIQLVVDFCNYTYKYDLNRIYYLTDNTMIEKKEILLCLSKYVYPRKFFEEELTLIYYDLAIYLGLYRFDLPILDEYFQEYKYLKVTNSISNVFLDRVNKNAIERKYNSLIPLRSEKTETIDKNDAYIYFVDAMGVEYLAYITEKCRLLNLCTNTMICRANLPSITSENKEFLEEFDIKNLSSIKLLDDIKHHGTEDYDYQKVKQPLYIARELEIINTLLFKIKEKLSSGKYKKIIIISDHGASRLAVTNGKMINDLSADLKGLHSGRCCLYDNKQVLNINNVTEENGYYVLADYSRFKGSRAASVETHGGATLEETIVPIIEFTLIDKNNFLEVQKTKFVLKRNEPIVVEIFSKTEMNELCMEINGTRINGTSTDNHNYKFKIESIKRKGLYKAIFYSNNNRIQDELELIVEKAGIIEKDLF